MFYDILDKERLNILPFLRSLKKDFYLAGGTALALQIGHRDSIDFDFFTNKPFDTKDLFSQLKDVFVDYNIKKIQEEKDTLSVLVNNKIKISFFSYKYPLLNKLIKEKDINLASIEDIACMKLSAITGRASNKDYIDLYFILQKMSLPILLQRVSEKFTDLDVNLIIKSLVYFDDIEDEKIIFKNNQTVNFNKVKNFLKEKVKSIK